MPLTDKGRKMMAAMKSEYGDKKGEQVFYATKNKHHTKGLEGKMHSPARDTEAFDEAFLGDGNVPSVGLATGGKSVPNMTVSAAPSPKNVQTNSGMDNPRADYQCFEGKDSTTPSGGRSGPTFGGGRETGGSLTKYSDSAV